MSLRHYIAAGGFLLVTFILKSILNTFLTVAFLAWMVVAFVSGGGTFTGGGGGGGDKKKGSDSSGNETLDEARKIMDKYK